MPPERNDSPLWPKANHQERKIHSEIDNLQGGFLQGYNQFGKATVEMKDGGVFHHGVPYNLGSVGIGEQVNPTLSAVGKYDFLGQQGINTVPTGTQQIEPPVEVNEYNIKILYRYEVGGVRKLAIGGDGRTTLTVVADTDVVGSETYVLTSTDPAEDRWIASEKRGTEERLRIFYGNTVDGSNFDYTGPLVPEMNPKHAGFWNSAPLERPSAAYANSTIVPPDYTPIGTPGTTTSTIDEDGFGALTLITTTYPFSGTNVLDSQATDTYTWTGNNNDVVVVNQREAIATVDMSTQYSQGVVWQNSYSENTGSLIIDYDSRLLEERLAPTDLFLTLTEEDYDSSYNATTTFNIGPTQTRTQTRSASGTNLQPDLNPPPDTPGGLERTYETIYVVDASNYAWRELERTGTARMGLSGGEGGINFSLTSPAVTDTYNYTIAGTDYTSPALGANGFSTHFLDGNGVRTFQGIVLATETTSLISNTETNITFNRRTLEISGSALNQTSSDSVVVTASQLPLETGAVNVEVVAVALTIEPT